MANGRKPIQALLETELVDRFHDAVSDCSFRNAEVLRGFAKWFCSMDRKQRDAWVDAAMECKDGSPLMDLIRPMVRKIIDEEYEIE